LVQNKDAMQFCVGKFMFLVEAERLLIWFYSFSIGRIKNHPF